MENRFTFKDFIFAVLILGVISAVILAMWQFGYQEIRLNDVKTQLITLNDNQRRQTELLEQMLARGVSASSAPAVPSTSASTQIAGTQPSVTGVFREQRPDGSEYVYAPHPPVAENDPRGKPDFAQGDWLVENLGDEPGTITPYLARTESEWTAANNILENLVVRDRYTLEYQPWLAESYTIMPDHVTVRFVMRKEATFSDGQPVTVDDVVFTFDTIMNKDIDADPTRAGFARVESCKKIDDRTVEFKFKEPYFDELGICQFPIMPKHIYQWKNPSDFNNNKLTVVGSGGYRFERWDRGQKLVLVRNEQYWGPKPTFDKLVYVFIMNPQASLQSFQNGQIDVDSPDPDQWERLVKDQDFTSKIHYYKYIAPDGGYRFIGWNEARPMFKDKLTRQALTMLIDRDAMIQTLERGMALPTTGPFNPSSPQYDTGIKPWLADPEGAKQKLAEAGWKMGPDGILTRDGAPFKFEFTIPAGLPRYERAAVYVKEQLGKAGIQMTITPYEFSVMSERLDNRDFDAAMLGWTASAGEEDPTSIWSSKSIAGKGQNFVAFRNAEADQIIETAVHEMNKDKRMVLWHQLHQIIHEEQPYTFLQVGVARVFINQRFENTEPDKMGLDEGAWYVPASKQKYH